MCSNGAVAVPCGSTAKPITAGLLGLSGYTDAGTSLATAVGSCSAASGIQVSQAITVASSVTVPAACVLKFVPGGELLPASGVTVTISGGIQASSTQQIFGGAGAIAGLTGDVPAGWFGAYPVPSLSAAASKEYTSALQAGLNSITSGTLKLDAGYYGMQTCGLSISKPNVGVSGLSGGYSYPNGSSPASVLACNSASADILDVGGSNLVWNIFHDFALQRTVVPTGSAKGFSCNGVGGMQMNHVYAEDSVTDFYFHSCPGDGVGSIENTSAGWGFSGPTAYSSSQTLNGYWLDSSDGAAENTLLFRNASVAVNITGPTTVGMYIAGTALNDIDVDFLNSAGTSYGIEISCGGSGSCGNASDLHFRNATIDEFKISGVLITGVPASAVGAISFEDGLLASQINGAQYGIDVEGSSGVIISDMQMNNANGQGGVYLHNSSSVSVNHNLFYNVAGTPIGISSSSGNVVSGNVMRNTGSVSAGAGIGTASATNNVIIGNIAAGNIGTVIGLDGASQMANTVSGNMANGISGSGFPYLQFASASTTNAGFTFASAVTDACAFAGSNFTGQHFVVGTTSSGVVAGWDAANNAGCISAISPGVSWRTLNLQKFGGNVAIGAQGTATGAVARLTVSPPSTADNLATTQLNANDKTQKALVVQGAAGQTANVQEWQSSTGAVLGSMSPAGVLTVQSCSGCGGSSATYGTPTTSLPSDFGTASQWQFDDHGFNLAYTAPSGGVAAGTAFSTVNFGGTWAHNPVCTVTPVGLPSANVVFTTVSTTQIVFSTATGQTLAANTIYSWNVACVGIE